MRFLLARARPDEARPLLQEAARLSPVDQTVRDLLAKIPTATSTAESYLDLSLQHYRAGRFAESIAAARAALGLRPGYAEAWNHIGAAYNQLGQYDQGAATCEKALRLKPDFELARNNLQCARDGEGAPEITRGVCGQDFPSAIPAFGD